MSNREERKLFQLFTKEWQLRGLNQSGSDKERLKTRRVSAATKSQSGSIGAGITSHRPIIFHQQWHKTQSVRIITCTEFKAKTVSDGGKRNKTSHQIKLPSVCRRVYNLKMLLLAMTLKLCVCVCLWDRMKGIEKHFCPRLWLICLQQLYHIMRINLAALLRWQARRYRRNCWGVSAS